jgi:hypothetical protein
MTESHVLAVNVAGLLTRVFASSKAAAIVWLLLTLQQGLD